MIICTVTAANHLAYAQVLVKSVKAHVKDCRFVFCLVENGLHPDAASFECMDDVVLAKNLEIPDFEELVTKRDIYGMTTILKPYLLLHLFDRYADETKFIYLDADIRVYSSFDELDKLLNRYSIILTPHRLEPQNYLNSIEEELVNLKDGVFQVGFLGLSKTAESRRFLKWWAARCHDYAIIDYKKGLFLDQKWLNHVPSFFKEVYILRDPSYHMASWNLSQRRLTRKGKDQYYVNGRPLVFFHFSGTGRWLDKSIRLHTSDDNVQKLVDQYQDDLLSTGHNNFKNIPWDYEMIMRYEERNKRPAIEMNSTHEENRVPILESESPNLSDNMSSPILLKEEIQTNQAFIKIIKIWNNIITFLKLVIFRRK
ncbi:hypothetical protein PASE110613_05610 [Paenibacillus sediminis]|uniref:Glycosyl transferase n=1 Tax=Paenibacillus sediminis TaxID=664909 RepID=A0ABS4H153_9BACL|nr:hypothetical protein [Paenibacillus sediminis]MBP1936254.1 hypothetical protein [Paenibacillus sediminis]